MQRFDKTFKEEFITKNPQKPIPKKYGICIYQPYKKNKEITRVWFHPDLITNLRAKLPNLNSFDILFDTEKKVLQFQFGTNMTFPLEGRSSNFCNINEFFQLLTEWNFAIAKTGDAEDGYVITEDLTSDETGFTYTVDFSQDPTQWIQDQHNQS
jgi:hypothetical protein